MGHGHCYGRQIPSFFFFLFLFLFLFFFFFVLYKFLL
jgi:hypothetical protein